MGSLVRTTQYTFVPAPELIAPASSILFVHSILARPEPHLGWAWLQLSSSGLGSCDPRGQHKHGLLQAVACARATRKGTGDLVYLGLFVFYFTFLCPNVFFFFFSLLAQSSTSTKSGQSFQYFKLMTTRNNVACIWRGNVMIARYSVQKMYTV